MLLRGIEEMISAIITLDDACLTDPHRLEQVLEACAAHGFELTRQLTNIGVICGQLPTDRLEDLRAVPGICSVELDEQRFAL